MLRVKKTMRVKMGRAKGHQAKNRVSDTEWTVADEKKKNKTGRKPVKKVSTDGNGIVQVPVLFKEVDLSTPTHSLLTTPHAQFCHELPMEMENDDRMIENTGIYGGLDAGEEDDMDIPPLQIVHEEYHLMDEFDAPEQDSLATDDNVTYSPRASSPSSIETDSDSDVPKRKKKFVKIDITELINGGNPIWEEVIENYREEGSLSKRDRTSVLDAIILHAQLKKIEIPDPSMHDIAHQLCRVFPTEIPTTYFMKMGNKSTGYFVSRYQYKRRLLLEKQKNRKRNDDEENKEMLVEPTDSMTILKSDEETDERYIEHWEATFDYRQKTIPETLFGVMKMWSILTKPIGPSLVNMDFVKIYGDREVSPDKWSSLFSKNWIYLFKAMNKKAKTFAIKVRQLEESSAKDAALSMLLHLLLPPTFSKGSWKPGFVDSQNSFLFHNSLTSIDDLMTSRERRCEKRNIDRHPYIIGVGPSKLNIQHFYVVILNWKFKAESFLDALNLCMRYYILYDIPYPPESKAVWMLINKIFYNSKVDHLLTPRVLRLIHELK